MCSLFILIRTEILRFSTVRGVFVYYNILWFCIKISTYDKWLIQEISIFFHGHLLL